MVREYKRKTEKGLFDENDMAGAIKAVLKKELSERKAVSHFGINRSTQGN